MKKLNKKSIYYFALYEAVQWFSLELGCTEKHPNYHWTVELIIDQRFNFEVFIYIFNYYFLIKFLIYFILNFFITLYFNFV